jgi:hypothetical protein
LVNFNNILSTRYWYENDVTALGYLWARRAIDFCRNCRYTCIHLDQTYTTREDFENSISYNDPVFFHGYGHGNQTQFTGYYGVILESCVNDQLLAGRLTYLVSCETGAGLGPSIIEKGGWGYIGYRNYYWAMDFAYAFKSPDDALCGRYHWSFLDHTNSVVDSILRGRTLSEAHANSLRRIQAWIDYWSQSDDPNAPDIIWCLISDRDGQVQLGDGNATIKPPISGKHVRDCYAVGFKGSIAVTKGIVRLKIGCSCHVEDCNFVGKKWTIKRRDTGETVASGTFTTFDRGLNFADATFTAPDGSGIYYYNLIVEGDELHDETVGYINIMVTEYVDLYIFTLDEVFGNPIYNATVTINGTTTSTDQQGCAFLEVKTGTYTVTVEAPGFETQTRTINVTGEWPVQVEKLYLRPISEGVFFEGYVRDVAGNPVEGALVILGTRELKTTTDSSGYYRLPKDFTLPRGVAYPITVVHPDYKPQTVLVNATSMNTGYRLNFTLEPIEPSTIYIVGNTRDKNSFAEVPNPNRCSIEQITTTTATASIESNCRGIFIVKITAPEWKEGSVFEANITIDKDMPQAQLPPPPYDQQFMPNYPSYAGAIINIAETRRTCKHVGSIELAEDLSSIIRNWIIKGFIVDAAYKPMKGVSIRVLGFPVESHFDYPLEPPTSYTTTTDENGFFEVTVAKFNAVGILYEFDVTYYPGRSETLKFNIPATADISRRLPVYTLTISISPPEGGTTDPPPGEHTYDENETVKVTAIPNEKLGYRFNCWLLNGQVRAENPTYVKMDRDYSLIAHFIRTYTLTISVSEGGTTEPPPGTYPDIPEGSTISILAKPYPGYSFLYFIVDGETVKSNPITITIDRNYTVTAVFIPIMPAITAPLILLTPILGITGIILHTTMKRRKVEKKKK